MVESNTKDTTPVVASARSGTNSFVKRELNGATFLTLEHIAHMVLVVVVTSLVTAGAVAALSLWTGASGLATMVSGAMLGTAHLEATMAIGIVAALLVLVPMLVVFDRRTRAEWFKRSGYANRVAYKVPVYGALGILVAVKIVAVIQMLSVILMSLAMLGASDGSVSHMYVTQFVPAVITALIFGSSAWYVFLLAKGRDNGRLFSMTMALLGLGLAITLFITAIVAFHGDNGTESLREQDYFNHYNNAPGKDLEDLFRY